MAATKNGADNEAPAFTPEEWKELSKMLWKEFRSRAGNTSNESVQTSAQIAIALAAIQPFKPK